MLGLLVELSSGLLLSQSSCWFESGVEGEEDEDEEEKNSKLTIRPVNAAAT